MMNNILIEIQENGLWLSLPVGLRVSFSPDGKLQVGIRGQDDFIQGINE